MNYRRAAGLSLILTLAVCASAFGQTIEVSGRVSSQAGLPLPGVTVRVRGTDAVTTTDGEGRYSLAAPSDGVAVFALTGYRGIGETIRGRTVIDVALEPAIAVVPDTVVTGYTTQRRADISGAVATIDVTDLSRQTSTSILQRLDGRVPGVSVENGGSPGSRTTVRVRGMTSFHDNDPLYVIDGTPVQESYLNWLSPDDIEQIQILKDASATSIYGSRGGNGVVVIVTKLGRPGRPQATLDVRTGAATPVRGYDDFLTLNALDYFEVLKAAYRNAGLNVPTNIYGNDTLGNNPAVPAYIWPNNCGTPPGTAPCNNVDTATYSYPDNLIMPGSAGTNWWDAVFGTGMYRDANLAVSGGEVDRAYHVSFNYFDQEGTAAYNRLQRGSARVNTSFTTGRLHVGERLAVSRERRYGGLDDNALGENNIIGKNMLQQPVVPIYDVGGNFASGKAPGLGNATNPLKIAYFGKDNVTTNDRIFGTAFAALDAGRGITLKTQFGFDLGQSSFRGYSPSFPENSEPTTVDGINEDYGQATDWTWSNTVKYAGAAGEHHVSVLLGHEANRSNTRLEQGSCANLLNPDLDSRYIQDALCDPTTKQVSSVGARWELLSFFGKADYDYAGRYFASVTLRRDGSRRSGADRRWGTFPGLSLAWRPFREALLRFGWGVAGAQPIPSAQIFNRSGGGNTFLPWEENHSMNLGADLAIWDGRGTFTVDVYRREADSLWSVPTFTLARAGKMRNTGIDFSLGYQGTIGKTALSATFSGSHYRNTILRIDAVGSQYFSGPVALHEQDPVINMIGHPIGAFYGFVADGYYLDSLDAAPYWGSGARPGRIKFRDVNNDGAITLADRAVIGSPHPDFIAGLDLGLRRGAWNLDITLFGTFGNEIFNSQKYWYVFRFFDTNVRRDLLVNSAVLDGPCSGNACPGRVTNPNAKYPRLDVNDVFSRQFSSYWVEDGSYVRLRSIQVGYDLPPALVRWIPAARVYIRGENLFTIAGYSGPDPALPAWDVQGAGVDFRDQMRGVDGGSYPASRMLSIGIMTTF